MSRIFTRERFGRPQILAGLMLLGFLAECVWLAGHERRMDTGAADAELARIEEGVEQWRGGAIAGTPAANTSREMLQPAAGRFDPRHSPLWYLIGSAPVAVLRISPESWAWVWLTRAPYILIGALLGASVWYVARRLYGNAGGYIALGLYCSSPTVIRSSALWFSPPHIAAVWGAFGAVFTGVAVSHTLYAPREVVLWNWRRIVLLGIALGLAIGSQFSMAIVVPALVVLMLYLAPERKAAAMAILAFACGIAVLILLASYFFHPTIFWHGLMHARWTDWTSRALAMPGAYLQAASEISESGPVLALMLPVGLITFAVWKRSRYFGNGAPLGMAAVLILLRVASPHEAVSVFSLAAAVFLFVFVSGMAADLLETRAHEAILALTVALVVANAAWNLIGLGRIAR
jgi:hypothetical protein